MLKWNSLAFRCNNSLRAGLPKSAGPWRGAWGCLQEWAGCGPKRQSRFVQSLIDQREELIIFQAALQIGSLGISARIPKEMFLMVINVFPVTFKRHTRCNKAEDGLEKTQLVWKGALTVNFIARDSFISRTKNDSHCPSMCAANKGWGRGVQDMCTAQLPPLKTPRGHTLFP